MNVVKFPFHVLVTAKQSMSYFFATHLAFLTGLPLALFVFWDLVRTRAIAPDAMTLRAQYRATFQTESEDQNARQRALKEKKMLHESLSIKEDSLYRLEKALSEKTDYIKTIEHILDIHRHTHNEFQAKHTMLQKELKHKQTEMDALNKQLEEITRMREHDLCQAEKQQDHARSTLQDLRQDYASKTRLLIQIEKDMNRLRDAYAKQEQDNEALHETLNQKEDALLQVKQCLIKILDDAQPETLSPDTLSKMQKVLDGLNSSS
ncbi:hypothetical protein BCR43DRAFT_75618 [Syncephalastrum racemosum]|uniref:Uncharacterized protein n=1 Tax=Syncephalastrum racemosum TaxID=13706 RepID=A0A1X2H2D4_SYNRA|nr:hypothetical protein BCR43DRAFT_75618 [Syncephalastrum racemosum]